MVGDSLDKTIGLTEISSTLAGDSRDSNCSAPLLFKHPRETILTAILNSDAFQTSTGDALDNSFELQDSPSIDKRQPR